MRLFVFSVSVVLNFSFLSNCMMESIYFSKIYYDSANVDCVDALTKKEVDIPPGFQSTVLACAISCITDSACDFFAVNNPKCVLYQGQAPPGSLDNPTGDFIGIYQRGTSTDLALHKSVSDPGTHADYPVPFSSIVDGVICGRIDKYSCPCTAAMKNPYVTIDLGSSYAIGKVIITSSLGTRAASIKKIGIYIGDTGSYSTDPLVAQRNDSYVTAYNAETFTVTGQGRYVTIHKTYSSGGSMCMCHLQINLLQ